MTENKQRKLKEFAGRCLRAAEYRGLREHGRASSIAAEFEKRGIQMSSMSVGRWFKGITMPASTNLQVLAEVLNVNAEWLFSGRGPMVNTSATTPEGETVSVVVNELPLIAEAQLSDWLAGRISPKKDILVAGSVSSKAFVFALPDRSLAPRIAKGSLLVVDPGRAVDPSLPIMVHDKGITLFGYPVLRQDALILEPANTEYSTSRVPNTSLIGPVIAIAQQFL